MNLGQAAIKQAREYEQSHAAEADNPVLLKAAELRAMWAKMGLFHRENATSIAISLCWPAYPYAFADGTGPRVDRFPLTIEAPIQPPVAPADAEPSRS